MENLIFFKCWQNYSISSYYHMFHDTLIYLHSRGGGGKKVFKFSSLKGEENLQKKNLK